MTSASHQPTMYQHEIDEIESNPCSAKAKKARQKLCLIATNDSDIWSELQKEMRGTRLITNSGIREALNASMLDNLADKLIARGAVKENPDQVRKNAAIEKGVLDFAKEKFGNEDFTSSWKSLRTFVSTNKSDAPPSLQSGDMRKMGERGRFCCANQMSQRNVHSIDFSSASKIFRSKNELAATKSEDSLLYSRKKSNSSTNIGNIRRPFIDSGISRDQSLRTLLGLALATTADSKPGCDDQCADEITSSPSSPQKKSFEESPPSILARKMCEEDDYDLYVPFSVKSLSRRHTHKEGTVQNYRRGTAMRTRRKMGSSNVKAASVVLQNNFSHRMHA